MVLSIHTYTNPKPEPLIISLPHEFLTDIIVGIVTLYRLDNLWFKSQWVQYFPHLSRPTLRSTQPPVHLYLGSFLRVKQLGNGVNQPPPPSAEVKEREKLYLCLFKSQNLTFLWHSRNRCKLVQILSNKRQTNRLSIMI
jgi:hypothetical protein